MTTPWPSSQRADRGDTRRLDAAAAALPDQPSPAARRGGTSARPRPQASAAGGGVSLPWLLLAVAWAILGWLLMTMPGEAGPSPFSHWLPAPLSPFTDKIGHFGLFLVQALLLHLALHRRLGSARALLVAASFAFLWGGAAEIRQLTVPGRSAELADLVADVAGAGAYAAGYAGLAGLLARRR